MKELRVEDLELQLERYDMSTLNPQLSTTHNSQLSILN